jgi:hypothetical protein
LEWRKIVGVLKDLNPAGFFCVAAFGMQDFFLPNPLKFICDGFLHRSFGGKKHELKPLGNFALSLSSNSCVASKCSIEKLLAF